MRNGKGHENHKFASIRIGGNLRRLRLLAGLSQTALAEKLGITFQQIQKYEEGSNRISAPVLYQLKNTFHCAFDDFFEGLHAGNDIAGPVLSSRQKNMVCRLTRAVLLIERPTVQNYFVKLAESIATDQGNK